MPEFLAEEIPYNYSIELKTDEGKTVTTNTSIYFLGKLLKEMKSGFSPMVLIVGKQRSGKSFVANIIALWIMRAYGKEDRFDPIKQSFYEPMVAMDRIGNKEKEPVIIDEAGAFLGRRQWYQNVNKCLEKAILTQGYKTLCWIFISPFASDLDKIFTKHFDFLIIVKKRGIFITFKIKKRYDELNRYIIKRSFLDKISYNKRDLPKEIWDRYEKYSLKEKERLRKTYVDGDNEKTNKTPFDVVKDQLREVNDKLFR